MYYIHPKDADPETGDPFPDQPSAVIALKRDPAGLKMTFVPTEDQLREWRNREWARFNSREYQVVPWSPRYALLDHFAHLSHSIPGMIAYTKSPEHGIADRQTRVKPGRYLQEFYSDLFNADVIADLIAQCTCITEGLKIAITPDEIEQVYLGGPESCMSKDRSYYDSDEHPVRVYGNSDLQIAYYGDPDHASARALIWPATMRHSRVYGGNGVLEQLLTKAGYRPGSLDGARIRAISAGRGSYVIPYVDYIDFARVDSTGAWLILGDGSINAQRTNGVSRVRLQECVNCDTEYDPDDEGGDGYCQSCYDDRYSTCADCNDTVRSDRTEANNGDTLCRSCYQERHSHCAIPDCDNSWLENELSRTDQVNRRINHLSEICPDCAENYKWCPDCEVYYPIPATNDATIQRALLPDTWNTLNDQSAGIVPARDLPIPDPIYSPFCSTCSRAIVCSDTLPLNLVPVLSPDNYIEGCDCRTCEEIRANMPIPVIVPTNPRVYTDRSL